MNALVEKARQRKAKIDQERQQNEAREREYNEALESLEEREYRVSLPGYYEEGGSDSHAAIRSDRLALQEMWEEEKNGIEAYREQVNHTDEKSTDELLADIRDSLEK